MAKPFLIFLLGTTVFPLLHAESTPPVPNGRLSRVQEISAMLDPLPSGVGQPISNRKKWEALSNPKILSDAQRYLTEPTPDLTDEIYLDFSKTGSRTRYEQTADRRRLRLVTWVLAEGFENRGRFLSAIEKEITAICHEKTWVLPAHDKKLGNFNGTIIENDLGSAMTSWTLATSDYWLGEKLSKETRKLIRDETRRRVLVPFLDEIHNKAPQEWWRTSLFNWNVVVHAGITGTATALNESIEERAEIIAATESDVKLYLQGFKKDGYSSEGLGYWNYGFGHYVLLAETILGATHGKLNLYDNEQATAVMLYPRRIHILSGIYPAFSDCPVGEQPAEWVQYIIEKRLGFPTTAKTPPPLNPMYGALLYAWGVNTFFEDQTLPGLKPTSISLTQSESPLRSWFEESQVFVGRPSSKEGLALAFKGGNNGESHGHNDLGSFVVVKGTESLLLDPGLVAYTAATFGPKRFENSLLNSYGHSVPQVAGKLQKEGAQHLSTVVEKKFTEALDSITLDLSKAYEVPELRQLTRRFDYARSTPSEITVTDQVAFATPQSFGTALITYGTAQETSPGVFLFQQKNEFVQVTIETQGVPFTINNEILKETTKSGQKVRRLGINLSQPVTSATITLKIAPAQKPATP